MGRAESLTNKTVGTDDLHMVLIPDEVWKEVEEMCLRVGLKPQDGVAWMVAFALDNKGEFAGWMNDYIKSRNGGF